MGEYQPLITSIQTVALAVMGYIITYLKKLNRKVNSSVSKKYLDTEIEKLELKLKDSVSSMQALTERGIKSGEMSRKEIRVKAAELEIELARLDSFVINNSDYKKKNS